MLSLTALVLDAVVLAAFLVIKATSNPLIVVVAAVGMNLIFGTEAWFLRRADTGDSGNDEPEI